MPKIFYTGINQEISTSKLRTNLLDISVKNKIPHLRACGGKGQCTTCRIRVTKGQQNLSPPTAIERRIAHKKRWDPTIRLACQCMVNGDIEIQRLLWTHAEISQIQLEDVDQGTAKECEIAILCCDMRNFTKITSDQLTFDMAHMLNRFYQVLGEPILKNNGIIYQYVGDEIIGIFGISGGSKADNCKSALRAALGMQYAIESLNHLELKDFQTNFKIGIGINYGKAYIGYLGHPGHRQLAVVGDPINIASRIQEQTKATQTQILISHPVFFDRKILKIGQWFKKELQGKEKPIFIYEFLGFIETDIHFELQASLDMILQKEKDFARRFYEKLFQKAPSIQSLFNGDIDAQSKILTHMLVGIVYTLNQPEYLSTSLKQLGHSHVQYGVKASHYPIVTEVLLATIQEILGDQYTQSAAEAWTKALTLITNLMQA